MKPVVKALLSATLLIAGAGIGRSFADEREVNNIWWNLDSDYNDTHQTVCVAENYNDYPVDAVFEVYPGTFDLEGNPVPGTAVLSMRPYVTYKLFGWPDGSGPDHRCALRSYTVHTP